MIHDDPIRQVLLSAIGAVFVGFALFALTTEALAEENYSRPGIPDAGWVDIYFDGFDRVAESAGLTPLRRKRLANHRSEVRVWIGGGIGYPQSLYRLMIDNGDVSGEWIWHWPISDYTFTDEGHTFHDLMRYNNQGSCEDFRRIDEAGTCRVMLEPEPSWADLLRDAEQAGLWALPDSSKLPPSRTMTLDGWSLTVELLDGLFYRTYHYSNPQHREWPEARRAERIADIFRALDRRVPPSSVEGTYLGTLEPFGHRLRPCDGSEPWFIRSHLSDLIYHGPLVLPPNESTSYVVRMRARVMPPWLARDKEYPSERVLQSIELLSIRAASDVVCSGS